MLKIWIGWDERDAAAYEVCKLSLLSEASVPVKIQSVKEWECRQFRPRLYWREDRRDGSGQRYDSIDDRPFSTGFSFTRFCVPFMENWEADWVLFCDPDMVWRADVAELFALADPDKSLMCVQHRHEPDAHLKMGDLIQTRYRRKNWSSLMLMNVNRIQQVGSLTRHTLNNKPHDWLHGLHWLPDDEIGALPEEWNWLEGHSDPEIEPKVVHYTNGTPDMPGCESVMYADLWRQHYDKLPLRVAT